MYSNTWDRGIGTINQTSHDYPELLRQIGKPPETIYFRGDITLCDSPCLGVVGARKATPYGKWVAYQLAKRAAGLGITVVSGMASGIDSAAHRGALDAEGKTIAILGCGPDVCFPKGNQDLMQTIIEKGLILSEYAGGTKPLPFQFPQRNRMISGLSRAVVIVEAGISSGSLITAECALEQGREVYAVPGNINSIYSLGTNKLIQDGATPLVVIDDFLQSFYSRDMESTINPTPGQTGNRHQTASHSPTQAGGDSRKPEQCNFFSHLLNDPSLGQDEKQILSIIAQNGEVSMDFLCRESGKPSPQLSAIVTILEMKGWIQTALGKIFIAKYR